MERSAPASVAPAPLSITFSIETHVSTACALFPDSVGVHHRALPLMSAGHDALRLPREVSKHRRTVYMPPALYKGSYTSVRSKPFLQAMARLCG